MLWVWSPPGGMSAGTSGPPDWWRLHTWHSCSIRPTSLALKSAKAWRGPPECRMMRNVARNLEISPQSDGRSSTIKVFWADMAVEGEDLNWRFLRRASRELLRERPLARYVLIRAQVHYTTTTMTTCPSLYTDTCQGFTAFRGIDGLHVAGLLACSGPESSA